MHHFTPSDNITLLRGSAYTRGLKKTGAYMLREAFPQTFDSRDHFKPLGKASLRRLLEIYVDATNRYIKREAITLDMTEPHTRTVKYLQWLIKQAEDRPICPTDRDFRYVTDNTKHAYFWLPPGRSTYWYPATVRSFSQRAVTLKPASHPKVTVPIRSAHIVNADDLYMLLTLGEGFAKNWATAACVIAGELRTAQVVETFRAERERRLKKA